MDSPLVGAAAFSLAALVPTSVFAVQRAAGPAPAPDRAQVGVCTIGETSAPSTSFNNIDLTQLITFQLLDPAECAACTGGSVNLDQLRWQIHYNSSLCPLTFEVTVVGSDHGACPRPDTTKIVCPTFTFIYLATGGPPHIATIPFPPGCCVTGQAFVRVRINDMGGCIPGTVGVFARGPCTGPCRSYASYLGSPLDDSCNLLGATPTIAVDADCCSPTPARGRSWGELKLHYR